MGPDFHWSRSPLQKTLYYITHKEMDAFYNTTLCAIIGNVKMEASHTILHGCPLLQVLQYGMHIEQYYSHAHRSHPPSQAHLHHMDE